MPQLLFKWADDDIFGVETVGVVELFGIELSEDLDEFVDLVLETFDAGL